MLRDQLGDEVLEALGCLSAEFREVLELHYVQGKSYRDISRITRAPMGTVMSRLQSGAARPASQIGNLRHCHGHRSSRTPGGLTPDSRIPHLPNPVIYAPFPYRPRGLAAGSGAFGAENLLS